MKTNLLRTLVLTFTTACLLCVTSLPLKAQSYGPLVTTPSGLRYQDQVVGAGPTPQVGSHVIVKYTGKLLDGTVFDSGTLPYVQGVTELIAGWTEGVSTMKEGGKRKLVIPPELAYGQEGRPGVIPPNATLVFLIELVKVQ